MIRASHLTKQYGKKLAVDDLSFDVHPGRVTGFLGPNGAGKSSTMRLMLGMDSGRGATLFDDKPLASFAKPSQTVGALLEAKAFHPTRSARNHLRVLAAAGSIDDSRVAEVLRTVGLQDVADKAPGKFSLGMSQRLGIAAAILGQPKYLVLDEPANGLDPEGIAWLRNFLKQYADQGNAVFVSSHLLSEMAQMADDIVVIGKGRLIASSSMEALVSGSSQSGVFVRVAKADKPVLRKLLDAKGLPHQASGDGWTVHGSDVTTDDIGRAAFDAKLAVLELSRHDASLEDAFLELTGDAEEYKTVVPS